MEKEHSILHYIMRQCLDGEQPVKELSTYIDDSVNTINTLHYWLTNFNRLVIATETRFSFGNPPVYDFEYTFEAYDLNCLEVNNISYMRVGHHNEIVLHMPVNGIAKNIVIHSHVNAEYIKQMVVDHVARYSHHLYNNAPKTVQQYEAELTVLYKDGIITHEEKRELLNRFIKEGKQV